MIDFDPIKWLDDMLMSVLLGRGEKLEWPTTAATGATIENMLRSYGIKVYGRQYTNKDRSRPYGVTVRSEQATWARYLLKTYLAGGKMPQAWGVPAKPQGWGGMWAQIFTGGPKGGKR